ncbi:MAG: ABC transporter permease subunit [Cyclobacteriaceae bacterium]
MNKILKYGFLDLIRSNWLILYTGFYLIVSFGVLMANGDISKSVISLLNVIIMLIPLIATLYGIIYYYNSRDYVEMLLAQPITRRSIFMGQFLGLSLSLSTSFLVGTLIPFLFFGVTESVYLIHFLFLLIAGVFLTFIFCGLSYLLGLANDNKLKGFGLAILLWLFFAIIYDGIVVISLVKYEDYPLEKFTLISTLINPIDLSRIFIMLKFDAAALFGYTGALFNKFFGSGLGLAVALGALSLWSIVPVWLIIRIANRKDF